MTRIQGNHNIFNKDNIADFLEVWLKNDLLIGDEKQTFNRYYSGYRSHFGPYLKFHYNQQTLELFERIRTIQSPKVLEIGCGCGTETLWLAVQGVRVTGIDLSEDRLSVALRRQKILEQMYGKKLSCTFQKKSLLDINRNNYYDIIWMEQSFHHCEPRTEVYKKLKQLLKPGGYLIISEANAWNPFLQASLLLKRGWRTKKKFIDKKGRPHPYGNERIITPWDLNRGLNAQGIKKISVRFFRILPNIKLADLFLRLDRKIPAFLIFLFTHYNYTGQKIKK